MSSRTWVTGRRSDLGGERAQFPQHCPRRGRADPQELVPHADDRKGRRAPPSRAHRRGRDQVDLQPQDRRELGQHGPEVSGSGAFPAFFHQLPVSPVFLLSISFFLLYS